MKQFRNALDITVDNHIIVKGGYIQLPVPMTITKEWLKAPSIAEGYDSNGNSVLYPLHNFQVIEADLKPFIGKTVYVVPDDDLYYSYLEAVRQNMIIEQECMTAPEILEFISRSNKYMERITNQYSAISDLLISRIWSYQLFNRNMSNKCYQDAYKTLYTVSTLQLLLLIAVNTPKFCFDICFQPNT